MQITFRIIAMVTFKTSTSPQRHISDTYTYYPTDEEIESHLRDLETRDYFVVEAKVEKTYKLV